MAVIDMTQSVGVTWLLKCGTNIEYNATPEVASESSALFESWCETGSPRGRVVVPAAHGTTIIMLSEVAALTVGPPL